MVVIWFFLSKAWLLFVNQPILQCTFSTIQLNICEEKRASFFFGQEKREHLEHAIRFVVSTSINEPKNKTWVIGYFIIR